MSELRDYYDPQYKQWRLAVKRRDGFKCKMPGCGNPKCKALHVHHIKRWADFPQLRFEIDNGITLCKYCHKKINGKEESYESLFMSMTRPDDEIFILRLLYKEKRKRG